MDAGGGERTAGDDDVAQRGGERDGDCARAAGGDVEAALCAGECDVGDADVGAAAAERDGGGERSCRRRDATIDGDAREAETTSLLNEAADMPSSAVVGVSVEAMVAALLSSALAIVGDADDVDTQSLPPVAVTVCAAACRGAHRGRHKSAFSARSRMRVGVAYHTSAAGGNAVPESDMLAEFE